MSPFPKRLHAAGGLAGKALARDMINLPPQVRQPEYTGVPEAP